MRTKLYWCKMSSCLTEVVFREDGQPVCFWGFSEKGNVCEEPENNFVAIPLEPIAYKIYGVLKKWRLIK